MIDSKELGRRVYDKLGTGSVADSERISRALQDAYDRGRRDERERCAGIVRECTDENSPETPLSQRADDAFNDGYEGPMTPRIDAFGKVIAQAILEEGDRT